MKNLTESIDVVPIGLVHHDNYSQSYSVLQMTSYQSVEGYQDATSDEMDHTNTTGFNSQRRLGGITPTETRF